MNGIYIHFPFCEKRCTYCAFSSFCNLQEKDRYIDKLLEEIDEFNTKNLKINENLPIFHKNNDNFDKNNILKVDSVYIGGGTPSLLEIKDSEKIFASLNKKFKVARDSEITIESNPNSLTEEKLACYKKLGINRLSLGVQSLNDEKLKFLGRLHSSSQALEAIRLAKKYFDNISVDMLIGVKGQEEQAFIDELDRLIEEGVNHISTYMLQVEEGTELARQYQKNPFLLPDEDEIVKIYEKTREFLANRGFIQYEISNFAQKNKESRHNIKYWAGENYVGFGLSAHSYIYGFRSANANNFSDYYSGKKVLYEKLDKGQLIEEAVMLGLRCYCGVDITYLRKLGYDIEKNENFSYFCDKNIIKKENNRVFLNPKYYGVSNYIIVKLLG